MRTRLRVVLDTNVWLDWLVFDDPTIAPIKAAVATERARLPACRDPDDQKFLEAALAARAEFLLTKDRALLELARRPLPFRILAPEGFRRD